MKPTKANQSRSSWLVFLIFSVHYEKCDYIITVHRTNLSHCSPVHLLSFLVLAVLSCCPESHRKASLCQSCCISHLNCILSDQTDHLTQRLRPVPVWCWTMLRLRSPAELSWPQSKTGGQTLVRLLSAEGPIAPLLTELTLQLLAQVDTTKDKYHRCITEEPETGGKGDTGSIHPGPARLACIPQRFSVFQV